MNTRDCPYCGADREDTTEISFLVTEYNTELDAIEDVLHYRCNKCNKAFLLIQRYTFSDQFAVRLDPFMQGYYQCVFDRRMKEKEKEEKRDE